MYPETVSGLKRSYYARPFRDYPCFLALIVAEKAGEYCIAADEMFDRCKMLGFTGTKDEINHDIEQLIQDGRIIQENGRLYRVSTWTVQDDLAELLVKRMGDVIGYPSVLAYPCELSKVEFGHPLYERLNEALKTLLGRSLSIAVCSSTDESKLLLQAIRCIYNKASWAATLNYRTFISTSSKEEIATVAQVFGCEVYAVSDLLDCNNAPRLDIYVARHSWVHATRVTTIVVINGNSQITSEELYKLLGRERFGESVILLAEKSVFDSDAGNFLRGLSMVGVPTEHIGYVPEQHANPYDLHVFTRCEEIKNQQMFNMDICAG